MIKLKVNKRDRKAKLEKGQVPAVFYGAKQESTPVSVKEIDFLKVLGTAGESTVVTLEDDNGTHDSLIHDIQRHPVSGRIIHADFYILEKGKKVKVKVPLEFIGVSDAVKSLGGNLIKVTHELEIEATPANLPHNIEVDISKLVTFEDQIRASDIKLPNGVELVDGAEEVIALVQAAKEEVEETPAAIDLESIEVQKKGKKDEEGAASEEVAPKE